MMVILLYYLIIKQKNKLYLLGWTGKTCTTILEEDSNGNKHIKCICKELNSTTVVDDIKYIFNNSHLKDTFSSKGFK